jgi:hypothetical protein
MGLCVSMLSACGVSDRPLNTNSGLSSDAGDSTGGNSSNGGNSAGGRSTGGSISMVATGGTHVGGMVGAGGVPSNGGSGAGGRPPGTGGVGGGGPDNTPSVTGPTTTTAEGVLTNLPSGASIVSTTGGGLVITTLYVVLEVLPSLNAIQLWGDVENRGSSLECSPSITLAVNGYDVSTAVWGPAYKNASTLSTVCVAAGETAAIMGIDTNVSPTLLDQGAAITYAFDTIQSQNAVPHPGAPTLLTANVSTSVGSWVVGGDMNSGIVDVYNLSLDFFIRDSSGLLRDQESAYPNDLGTIPANTVVAYESYGTTDQFARFVQWPSFIEGVAANFVVGPPSAYVARRDLVKQRFADLAAARRLIRH